MAYAVNASRKNLTKHIDNWVKSEKCIGLDTEYNVFSTLARALLTRGGASPKADKSTDVMVLTYQLAESWVHDHNSAASAFDIVTVQGKTTALVFNANNPVNVPTIPKVSVYLLLTLRERWKAYYVEGQDLGYKKLHDFFNQCNTTNQPKYGRIAPKGFSAYLRTAARQALRRGCVSNTDSLLGEALVALAEKITLKDLSRLELIRLCMYTWKQQTSVCLEDTWTWSLVGDVSTLISLRLSDIEHLVFTRRNPMNAHDSKTYILFSMANGNWTILELTAWPTKVECVEEGTGGGPMAERVIAIRQYVEEFIRTCGIAKDVVDYCDDEDYDDDENEE